MWQNNSSKYPPDNFYCAVVCDLLTSNFAIIFMSTTPIPLTIAIHAHTPYVGAVARRQADSSASDAWFAFLAESFSPLLKTLLRLKNENIDAPLSLGLSPILCEMLSDLSLSSAYEKYLHRHIALCRAHEREFAARGQEEFANLSLFWENWYQSAERDWEEIFKRDPMEILRLLQDENRIEIFSAPATGAHLPYLHSETAIAAQLSIAAENYKKHFARRARGVWLPLDWRRPGDGPTPRLANLVSEAGFEYAIAGAPSARNDAATRYLAATSPLLSALLDSDNSEVSQHAGGVAVVGDVALLRPHDALCEQVWSRAGYAGDERFLDAERRAEPGHLRLWRISESDSLLTEREIFEPLGNATVCDAQAAHWLERAAQWREEGTRLCATFEADLLGQRWFEGPNWLYRVLKKVAHSETLKLQPARESVTMDAMQETTGDATHIVDTQPLTPESEVETSLWLNAQTEWLWPVIAACENEMEQLVHAHYDTNNPKLHEVLLQAARELLLLESGDWPTEVSTGAALHRVPAHQAANCFADHVAAFQRLQEIAETIANGEFMSEGQRIYLDFLCAHDNIFPELTLAHWMREKSPTFYSA